MSDEPATHGKMDPKERVSRLQRLALATRRSREALVQEVMEAFDEGVLGPERIGRAIGMSEAGARQIYRRAKAKQEEDEKKQATRR